MNKKIGIQKMCSQKQNTHIRRKQKEVLISLKYIYMNAWNFGKSFFPRMRGRSTCIVVMDIRTCGERRMKLSESRTLLQLIKMLEGLL